MAFHDAGSTSTEDEDFADFLPKSFFETLTKQLFHLFQEVADEAPSFNQLHDIISIIRLTQFIAPVFFTISSTFYNKDSPFFRFLDIFSIFFHFCRPSLIEKESVYYSSIYSIFTLGLFLLMLISSFSFSKSGFRSKFLGIFIGIFSQTLGYLIHPMIAQILSVLVFFCQ
jgi:hypothetical protein